jgi:PmbA protein
MDILELAARALEHAARLGAREAEVFLERTGRLALMAERSLLKTGERLSREAAIVRCYIGGSLGLASTTRLNLESVLEAVEGAVKLARSTPPDPRFRGLPSPGTYPSVDGLYDPGLASMDEEALARILAEGVERARGHPGVDVLGSIALTVSEEAVANTLGVAVKSTSTDLQASIQCKVERDGDVGTASDFLVTRDHREASLGELSQRTGERALSYLGARRVESGEYSLVMDERSTLLTMQGILMQAGSGLQVLLGRSYLAGRLGQPIGPETLTIIDDGVVAGGIHSRPFDDEGSPCMRKPLVERGVLRNFLTDSYTAQALGLPNTGNATRRYMPFTFRLRSRPQPAPSNLQVQPGDYTREELIAETRRGILLELSPLPPIGDTPIISSMIDHGFLIENGEIRHPVKNAMVGTTVPELLLNIDGIGRSVRNDAGQMAPYIRVRSVCVSSA